MYQIVFIDKQILITGSVEELTIIVKVLGFIPGYSFINLINFLKERKYRYVRMYNNKFWKKRCTEYKEFENELNELENLLIDEEISFINIIRGFVSLGNYWR